MENQKREGVAEAVGGRDARCAGVSMLGCGRLLLGTASLPASTPSQLLACIAASRAGTSQPARPSQPAHAGSLVPALHCLWCERCTAAPEPQFHAVWEASKRLVSAGFTQLSERQPWSLKPGGRYFFTRNARWGAASVDRLFCVWFGGGGVQSGATALFAVGCCSPHRAVSLCVGRWGWKAAAGAATAVLREGPLAGRPGSTPLRSAAP